MKEILGQIVGNILFETKISIGVTVFWPPEFELLKISCVCDLLMF